MAKAKEWTEYIVRCRRWVRDSAGKKVWETVDLSATDEQQALYFYRDIEKGNGALEDPKIVVRTVTEHPYDLTCHPDIHITPEFNLDDLIHWLGIAQGRYEEGGRLTGRIEGTAINIYQAGTYRAAIDLNDERPYMSDFADDDA